MAIRTIETTSYGRKVKLEQVEHHNYRGTVYVMSWGSHRLNAWGYGRGHTEAIESFRDPALFQKMADDYIETLARTDESIKKEGL